MSSSQNFNRFITISIILFLITLFTRFYQINSDSLWLDEGFSVRVASMPFQQMMFLNDKHQPLYIIILHYWIMLFRDSETAARSLSALFNILSFLLIIPIGKILFNKSIALFSLLIFSLASFQVYFAQETRSYSLMSFLSLLSIYLFLEIIRNPKKGFQTGYIISIVLLIFTHIYGWFVLLLENIWFIYKIKKKQAQITRTNWLLLQTIIVILIIPYMLVFIPKVINLMQNYWLKKPTILHLGGALLQFSGSLSLMILFVMLILYAGIKTFKDKITKYKFKEGALFMILWISIFLLTTFILSQFITPIFLPRYAISASIPFYFLVALAIEGLPKRTLKIVTVVMIICLSIFNLYIYYSQPTREPWRAAIKDLKNKADIDDIILIGSDAGEKNLGEIKLNLINDNFYIPDVFVYYANGIPQKIMAVDEEFTVNDSLKQNLIKTLSKAPNIWYVASHAVNYENQLVSLLKKYFDLRKTYSYPHHDLYGRKVDYLNIYQFSPKSSLFGLLEINPEPLLF